MRRVLCVLFALVLAGSATAQPVTTAPNANVISWATVTCGATSTPFGVTGNQYLTVNIPPDATATKVCFQYGPNAVATLLPPSQCFPPATTFTFGGGTGACIVSTGTQAVTVGTR